MVLPVHVVGVLCQYIVYSRCQDFSHTRCHQPYAQFLAMIGCMVTSLSSAVRLQIITFDLADPDLVPVSEFGKSLKIYRRGGFYTIRQRYAEETQVALHQRTTQNPTSAR